MAYSEFRKWFAMFVLLLIFSVNVHAQFFNGVRYNTYSLQSDTLFLDSLSIVPSSVIVRNLQEEVVDSSTYIIHHFSSQLIWKQKPDGSYIKVFYRVYPFSLTTPSTHKDYTAYKAGSENFLVKPFTYSPEETAKNFIDFGALDYNGSFSRGISFGSNQSVVLNSVFNMQLSGMVTRDLEITAAITDNNIPIQPEGNTQQIQEFDKIFIQLRKDQHKIIVGDFDLFNPERDYFMRFSKKYRGGSYSSAIDIKKKGILNTAVAGGISRGKFARNFLTVSDGNQGPYKLTGTNGETFLIILANTEEVYVNGQKMERGADRDYVIDYNIGEVTFMPRRIITKDLRVYVEFEYSEQNYLRSTAFAHSSFVAPKGNVHFSLYSEQDSKGQNVQQTLNAAKKTFLTTIGDSIQNAFYQGIDSVAFDANRILYKLQDTLVFPFTFDSILVYSTNPSEAKYAATFAFIGEGKGNYIPTTSTANGRVYQWIAPAIDSVNLTLTPRGSYEPVIFLVTPKYQQLYSLGGEYNISKTHTIAAELAVSNTDVNMYSKKNDNNNAGVATRVNYKGSVNTRLDTSNNPLQQLLIDFNYEFLQNRFNTIERYRNIEFNRDWNITGANTQNNEHLAVANLQYLWRGLGSVNYRFKSFIRDSVYSGYENALNGTFTKGIFNVAFSNSYLHSVSANNSTNYFRPKSDFSFLLTKKSGWRMGAIYDHEVNMLQDKNVDTLNANSFLWQNYKVYFQTADSTINQFGIEYVMRAEHHALNRGFDKPHFQAHTFNFTGRVNTIKNQTLNYTLTYRYAKEKDSITSTIPEHYYLGRIDYNLSILKGFIRSTTLYEIGTGRQQKTQLVYQLSPTNTGDYIWLGDINTNGVKDVNEFGIKNFNDTTSYVRVFVVTPEFVSVNTNQLNQVININPAAIWRTTTGFKKFVSMFSLLASIQLSKKTFVLRNKNVGEYFNPIPLRGNDEQLVSTAISSRNSLYFNRLEAKYGAQADFNYNRSRTLLTTGIENRFTQSQSILIRWNIFQSFNTQLIYLNGTKANESDFYQNLKYRFHYNDLNSTFSYQLKNYLRFDLKYDFSLKANPTDTVGKQTAQVHKVSLLVRYNRQNKSTIDGSITYATVLYNDKKYINPQLEYAMLEGLRNGNNLVWQVNFAQNLTQNIQLTIGYDGRMTGFEKDAKETLKPVHTGRAELRALF